MESCLKAVLSADIEGYTRRMHAQERATDRAVKSWMADMEKLIQEHGGVLTSPAGDGFIGHFNSALRAVECAVRMQQQVRTRSQQETQEDPIEFRVGINLGETIVDGDSVSGDCVNISDRLQKLADPGGIVVSSAVYEAIDKKVPFGFQCLGEKTLKNIAKRITTYRILSESSTGTRLPNRRPLLIRPAVPNRPSIVVLPFENMSGDSGRDFFSNGVTEDLITNLSRFRDLFIIARDSAFAYSEGRTERSSVKQVGEAFGVRYVLNGSVRWADKDKVRISVHLADSRYGTEIWSDHYDKTLRDIFAVQDEVTQEIASRLSVKIEASERDRALHTEIQTPEAYSLFLKGQSVFLKYSRESNTASRELFHDAIELDPGFARAYGAMAKTYGIDWRFAWGDLGDEALDRSLELAKTAISLDHADCRGHSELGYAYLYKKELGLALREYETALRLNPNDADVMAETADALVYAGRCEDAVNLLNKAMRLNPYHPDWYLWFLGGAYFQLGRYEDAIDTLLQMTNTTEGGRLLAASYAHLGRHDEAQEQAKLVLKAHPEFTIERWRGTQPFKDDAPLERLLSGLQIAGLPVS